MLVVVLVFCVFFFFVSIFHLIVVFVLRFFVFVSSLSCLFSFCFNLVILFLFRFRSYLTPFLPSFLDRPFHVFGGSVWAQLLADMEFADTDHAAEKQLKLDVIGVYNHRLDLREKRKQFVIEHNLLDVHKQQAAGGKKRPKVNSYGRGIGGTHGAPKPFPTLNSSNFVKKSFQL